MGEWCLSERGKRVAVVQAIAGEWCRSKSDEMLWPCEWQWWLLSDGEVVWQVV